MASSGSSVAAALPVHEVDEDGDDGVRFGFRNAPVTPELRQQFDRLVRLPAQVQSNPSAPCLRKTFIPITASPDAGQEVPRAETKFGGRPYLCSGEEAGLRCRCGRTLSFLFQLQAASLPHSLGAAFAPEDLREAPSVPLFQLWLCTHCLTRLPVKPGTYSCRWVDASTPSVDSNFTSQHEDRHRRVVPFVQGGAERRVTSWRAVRDVPECGEAEALWAVEVGDEWEGAGWDNPFQPVSREKLSGLPHWGNEPHYPLCGQCGQRAELFFQIHFDPVGDGEEIFHSDCQIGWGLIFSCPAHRREMSFVWSSA